MEKASFAAYRTLITDSQTPLSTGSIDPHQPIHRVVFWAETSASPGTVAGSLWEVPVQEGIHFCQNDPQIPKEKSTGGQRCPETACPSVSPGLQEVQPRLRGPCHRWGGHPLAHEFLPAVPAWAGGTQVFVLPPPPTAGGSGQTWSQAERRTRLGCAMELLPPPSSGQGRSSCAPAPPLYTKHTKEAMSQQSIHKVGQSQPWGKQEPSQWL